jgi:hypothetical protein
MFDQEREFPSNKKTWFGWPTEVLQRALAIIATTRSEWASRVAGDKPGASQGRSPQRSPVLGVEVRSSAGRAGRIRAGSGRRSRRQLAA